MAGLQPTGGRASNPGYALVVDRLRKNGFDDAQIEDVLSKMPPIPMTGVTAAAPKPFSPVRLPDVMPPVTSPVASPAAAPVSPLINVGAPNVGDQRIQEMMGMLGSGERSYENSQGLPRAQPRRPISPTPGLAVPPPIPDIQTPQDFMNRRPPITTLPGGPVPLPNAGVPAAPGAMASPGIPGPMAPGGVGFGPGEGDALLAMMSQMGGGNPMAGGAGPSALAGGASPPPASPGAEPGMMQRLLENPDLGRMLLEFGLGTMAAGGQPGASVGSSIGQGGLGALRSADTRKRYDKADKRADSADKRDARRLALDEAKAARDPIAKVDDKPDANGHIRAYTEQGRVLDLGKKAEGLTIKEKSDLMMKQSTDEVAGPLGTVKTFNRETWNKRARDYGLPDLVLSGDEKIKINPATGQRIKYDEKRKTWVDIQTLEPVAGAP